MINVECNRRGRGAGGEGGGGTYVDRLAGAFRCSVLDYRSMSGWAEVREGGKEGAHSGRLIGFVCGFYEWNTFFCEPSKKNVNSQETHLKRQCLCSVALIKKNALSGA